MFVLQSTLYHTIFREGVAQLAESWPSMYKALKLIASNAIPTMKEEEGNYMLKALLGYIAVSRLTWAT